MMDIHRLEDVKPRSWRIVETHGEGSDRVHLVRAKRVYPWLVAHDPADGAGLHIRMGSLFDDQTGALLCPDEATARGVVKVLKPLAVVRCIDTGRVLRRRDPETGEIVTVADIQDRLEAD